MISAQSRGGAGMKREKRAPSLATMVDFHDEITKGLGWGAILLGSVIVYGGRDSWSDRLYETALLFPWAPESLGFIVLVFGLSMTMGVSRWLYSPLITCLGSFGVGIWSMYFAVALGKEFLENKNVSAVTVAVFFTAAYLYLRVSATFRKKRMVVLYGTEPREGEEPV